MPDYSLKFKTLDTNLVHAGRPRPHVEGAVVTPVFQSANYLMGDEATYDAVRYIRLSNSPNHHTLQARLAAIESAEAALVTASGMAAISAVVLANQCCARFTSGQCHQPQFIALAQAREHFGFRSGNAAGRCDKL